MLDKITLIRVTDPSQALDLPLVIAMDCETTGLDIHRDKITDVLISVSPQHVYHLVPEVASQVLPKLVRHLIVMHNMAYDINIIRSNFGVDLRQYNQVRDTMLMHHLIDENKEHGLDAIVQDVYADKYKEVFWSKYKQMQDAPEVEKLEYAAKDAAYTLSLFLKFKDELRSRQSLVEHVHNLAYVLMNTEYEGIKVDMDYLVNKGTDLQKSIVSLHAQMLDSVKEHTVAIEDEMWLEALEERKTDKGKANVKRPEFNFDSQKQLVELLYHRLGLPEQKNRQRKVTVDDGALEALEDKHVFVKALREYRGHQKVYNSFIQGTLERVSNSRVYPSFRVAGTVTGRTSSANPNLQQLPSKGGVRGIYVPDADHCFISADYSQLEVTLAAHFSRDPNLLKIVFDGASQHDITAQGLGIPRPLAKTVNFALQYGAGAPKLQQILSCSESEAQAFYQKYWLTYPGLKAFNDTIHAKVDKGEPIENPFGRRRHFPKSFASFWDKERAKRQAPNALIQGTGADITNAALYLSNTDLVNNGIGKGLFVVHDEVVVTCLTKNAEQASVMVRDIMESMGKRINLSVPLKAEVQIMRERWSD